MASTQTFTTKPNHKDYIGLLIVIKSKCKQLANEVPLIDHKAYIATNNNILVDIHALA